MMRRDECLRRLARHHDDQIVVAVYQAAFDWVRASGVARIEVQVAHANAIGQAFWRARGFGDFMDVLDKRL